jgi:hypothetical protein
MSLDDSRDRVYINNLSSELDSIAADEAALESSRKLIFLPDIERHFNQMPREMLRLQSTFPDGRKRLNSDSREREGEHAQELVLYTLPRTLTQDATDTRKAILEARQRAREKALGEAREREMNAMYSSSTSTPGGSGGSVQGRIEEVDTDTETAHGYGAEGYEEWRDADEDDDDDAMDMD